MRVWTAGIGCARATARKRSGAVRYSPAGSPQGNGRGPETLEQIELIRVLQPVMARSGAVEAFAPVSVYLDRALEAEARSDFAGERAAPEDAAALPVSRARRPESPDRWSRGTCRSRTRPDRPDCSIHRMVRELIRSGPSPDASDRPMTNRKDPSRRRVRHARRSRRDAVRCGEAGIRAWSDSLRRCRSGSDRDTASMTRAISPELASRPGLLSSAGALGPVVRIVFPPLEGKGSSLNGAAPPWCASR